MDYPQSRGYVDGGSIVETFMMMECADGSARATPDEVRMLAQLYRLGNVRTHDLFGSWIRVATCQLSHVSHIGLDGEIE
mgnify:CR=1 FL=1